MRKINKVLNVLSYVSAFGLALFTGLTIATGISYRITEIEPLRVTGISFAVVGYVLFISTSFLFGLKDFDFGPSKKEIMQERNKMVDKLEQEVTGLRFDISYLNAKVRILEARIKVKVDKPIDKTRKDKK